MYRREPRHQLSFEDFFLPFGGKLSGDNRWIKLAELIPWEDLEDDYASQFCKGFGAPAKPFRMALGALIIKARLILTDEELVEQIKENPYLQFFIGLESFQYSAPFDPSMMVYFRKRLLESIVNDCNERIVRHGLNVIRSAESEDDENDNSDSGVPSDQPAQAGSDKASSNQGTLLIDATCVLADIRYVEFGAKISISVNGDGFTFLDRLSYDPYNEGEDLKAQARAFRCRHGHYPKVICADQIYRTRSNRAFCQRHGIRLSGPRLGRPQSDPQLLAEEKNQFVDDQRRRNAVEGKIGQGKRRYGLDLIREKLATTQGSAIALNVLVMNLEKLLELLFVLLAFWLQLLLGHRAACGSHVAVLNDQLAAA